MIDGPIDSHNKELFQYISSLLGEDSGIPSNIIMCLFDIQRTKELFAERYNNDEIDTTYTYREYIGDKKLQAILTRQGLDPDAFWLLVMFCFDFAFTSCNSRINVQVTSPLQKVWEILQAIYPRHIPGTGFTYQTATIKAGSRKVTVDPQGMTFVCKWIKQGFEQDIKLLMKPKFSIKEMDNESNSLFICYFAKLMEFFFKLNPQFKGRKKKGEEISLNKDLLIENLIYKTGISNNRNFITDVTPDTLKGYVKPYKKKQDIPFSSVYHGDYIARLQSSLSE